MSFGAPKQTALTVHLRDVQVECCKQRRGCHTDDAGAELWQHGKGRIRTGLIRESNEDS
jgi:hypothetical protein